jgi:methyl-accepting chemotaxis protein
MKFKGKFISLVLLILIVSFSTLYFISTTQSQRSLEESFVNKLIVARDSKIMFLQKTFSDIEKDIIYISELPSVLQELNNFYVGESYYKGLGDFDKFLKGLQLIFYENNPYTQREKLDNIFYDDNFDQSSIRAILYIICTHI